MKNSRSKSIFVPLLLSLFFLVASPSWGEPPGKIAQDMTISNADILEKEIVCNVFADNFEMVYLYDSPGGFFVKNGEILKLTSLTDEIKGKTYNTSGKIRPPDLSAGKNLNNNVITKEIDYAFKPQRNEILLC